MKLVSFVRKNVEDAGRGEPNPSVNERPDLRRTPSDGAPAVGLVTDRGVIDVTRVQGRARSLREILETDDLRSLASLAERPPDYTLEEISFLPVVADPEKILCVGLNYDAHRQETGRDKTSHPVLFTRFASTLVGHQQALVRPRVSTKLDFEGELAVVVGKRGRHIPEEQALEHIAGFTCFNDGSVRDWQRHTHQFTPGKNFPKTGALGPWLVTLDAITRPLELSLRTVINGLEMQTGHTSQMIFSVPTLVAYISKFCELVPGDIIATGTPSGVGYTREPPVYLAPGDTVEVEIEQIGKLVNTITDEEPGVPSQIAHGR